MAPDRDPQPVKFVKPDVLDCPRLSIGEDHGFAYKLGLRLFERTEDC